ncbi:MAG: insulinase family protein [Bacteroidales bacterium]
MSNFDNFPIDNSIITGKLSNGLSYYIIQDSTIKNYCDFYLIQKLNESINTPQEKIYNNIISNIAILESSNFKNTYLSDYFNHLGMKYQKDIQVENNLEDCRYLIRDIPIKRNPHTLDSMLLVLYNWSSTISINKENLSKYKNYIKNEYSKNTNLKQRLNSKFICKLFSENTYKENISNYILNEKFIENKTIEKFYKKWYRPDRQAIIIKGDVNPAEVVSKITTLFQIIPKSENTIINDTTSLYKAYFKKGKYNIVVCSDEELKETNISFYFPQPLLPTGKRKTAEPLVANYLNKIVEQLCISRIHLVCNHSIVPISSNQVKFTNLLGIRNIPALKISVTGRPEDTYSIISFISREIELINKYGFSEESYQKAMNNIIYNDAYYNVWTGDKVKKCISNYLDDYSLFSTSSLKSYLEKISPEISLETFNSYVSSLFSTKDILVSVANPNSFSYFVNSKKLNKAYLDGQENISSNDSTSLKGLINSIPKYEFPNITTTDDMVMINHEEKEYISNSSVYHLTNGVTVIYKKMKTKNDLMYMGAHAYGGYLKNDAISPNIKENLDILVNTAVGGDYNMFQIQDLMRNKNISIRKSIGDNEHFLNGYAPASEINNFMNLIRLHFLSNHEDYALFHRIFGSSNISDDEYYKVASYIHNAYSNASNFTFIFIGNIDVKKFKSYISKYIASLPANPSRTIRHRPLIKRDFQINDNKIYQKNEVPVTYYHSAISGPAKSDLEDIVKAQAIGVAITEYIQTKMLHFNINVDIKQQILTYPDNSMTLDFSFFTYNYQPGLNQKIFDLIYDMRSEKISDKTLNNIKSRLINQFYYHQNLDIFWIDILRIKYIYKKDYYSGYLLLVESLTKEDIYDSLDLYISHMKKISDIKKQ